MVGYNRNGCQSRNIPLASILLLGSVPWLPAFCCLPLPSPVGHAHCWRHCCTCFGMLLRMDTIRQTICVSCGYLSGHGRSLRLGTVLWQRSYFQVIYAYDFDLLRTAFVYCFSKLLLAACPSRISCAKTANWTKSPLLAERMLNFQRKAPFAISALASYFLKFPCFVVKRVHSTDELKHNGVGD